MDKKEIFKTKSDLVLYISNRGIIIVNEPGLYNVLLRSDKPQAKAFKRWVTHEVLPSICKTGSYNLINNDIMDAQDLTVQAKGIYMCLCKLAKGQNEIILNGDYIREMLNMGRDAYRNHFNKLKAAGYVESKPWRENGRFVGVKYTLHTELIMISDSQWFLPEDII